ncbi:MAG: hypothetical protein HN742_09965 [Lentisphaerae bacterium]|jgi:non-lysosomal glucosylceramidase|nr:hypothetical protein [Lentisphaerota bacterium]MBT4821330.1 hypothetical protein [Lentisphaerota bacterium]MBT5610436.1 hypothetical protein [Lentisphaerota bacterium]MBT7061027.1 hypothetical protein [Lentisphaerota bacterium]MBT7842188.1 hypothetical protein [Lentisphaerota bacterium]
MSPLNPHWPVLKSYDQDRLAQIGLPLGGIGTGTISLGGRGNLFDWEIHNRPKKNSDAAQNFGLKDYGAASLFVLYAREDGAAEPVVRGLEGVLRPPYEGSHGSVAGFHGVPRFRDCTFHAAYPLGQVALDDADMPLSVRVEAFNPLVPGAADRSGIPVAVLRYVLTSKTDRPVSATVCGSLMNLTGGSRRETAFRDENGVRGILMRSVEGDSLARDWGSLALTTTADDVSRKCHWPRESWRRSLLHFWDDLVDDGRLDDVVPPPDAPAGYASLAAHVTVAPGEETSVTFLVSWHFPNRYNWAPKTVDCDCGDARLNPDDRIGNWYTEQFEDAWGVARHTVRELPMLEADTLAFVGAFCDSDLPDVVKEAALFNLSTLRTETCFRTPDGNLYGWEGCCDGSGCCNGSCTHVWNYETTTAFLYGDLARTMRDVEFLHATHPETGCMSFRVQLPIEREKGEGKAAADGQMGCIMKAHREWKLSGDTAWLRRLWPRIRKALEFCWIPGGWDADQDGVMEGCQHNTMDVEYYGPNPQMGAWYLGALAAAADMARAIDDAAFAERCTDLLERGRAWVDGNLFNGEYYEHQVWPPKSPEAVASQTRLHMGASDLSNPDLQLGPGCLVDQLVGQYMAHVCGLGYVLDPEHVKETLAAIMRYNFRESLHGHFNNMRSYALNDEAALLMASYPRGGRPESPFPYFNEVMTGFEYCAATHMLYEGLTDEGLTAIAAIRARYDGWRRNPFNEAECGHHYARAMAAWTAVLAITGFHYDGTGGGSMTAADRDGRSFWSTGHAWGTCEVRKTAGCTQVELSVLYGELALGRFIVDDVGEVALGEPGTLHRGDTVSLRV